MQHVDPGLLLAVQGSHTPTVTVDAWYDGGLVLENVPVNGGAITIDGSRAIAGSLSLTSVSEDGSLVPDRWDAPLAPYGSQLHVRVGAQGSSEQVSLGWYRVDSSDPQEYWAEYRVSPTDDPDWVCRGMQVTTESSDRMSLVDDARFLSPEVPASTTSVLAEIKRLTQELVPLAPTAGITDAAIPAAIAYQTSRVQAVQDLADVIGRVARMDPDGALELVPKVASTVPVWTVAIGRDGHIVNWSRKLTRGDLYNGVISTGQTSDGTPVQGSKTEDVGPLRWGGPFGRVPYGHSSPLLTTNTAAQNDASTLLSRLVRERVAPVEVECLPHPGLQTNDCVALQLPGRTLTGPVLSIRMPLPITTMTITVLVPRTQLWGL